MGNHGTRKGNGKDGPVKMSRKNCNERKREKRMMLCVLFFFFLGLVPQIAETVRTSEDLQPAIARKVLRFHVLANSDGNEDQQLKEQVRDAIGNYLAPKMSEVTNLEECKKVVLESIPELTAVAKETIEQQGYDYEVTAQIARVHFPEKEYGPYCFPAGEYQALEVTIGQGKGHNWWCVLYPNMCFKNAVYEVVEEEERQELKEVLDEEEYESVFQPGKVKLQWKLGRKCLDFLEKTR